MNKVDPCSTIDHSHKNTRWIYVSAKSHIKYNKVLRNSGNSKKDNATVGPKVFNPNRPKKVRILTMRIKELKSNMEEAV